KDGPALSHGFRGLRGVNHLLEYWRQEKRRRKSRVIPSEYLLLRGQAAQGGLGAYLVTLTTAGFVDRSSLGLYETGRELAYAFLAGQARNARKLAVAEEQTWALLSSVGRTL